MFDRWSRDEACRGVVGTVVLHKGAAAWERRGRHPHGGLGAGETTLEVDLVRVLLRLVAEQLYYFRFEYARAYGEFLTDPESHSDSFADDAHLKFFANFKRADRDLDAMASDNETFANAGALAAAPAILVAVARNFAHVADCVEIKICKIRSNSSK